MRTRPGDLFSKEALERSYREIAQMGHFNPENIQPDVQPNPQDGTVDINWGLESKANDQVEFSAGWGQTGVIGKLSLKFTNFSFSERMTITAVSFLKETVRHLQSVVRQTVDTISRTAFRSSTHGSEENVLHLSLYRHSTLFRLTSAVTTITRHI